MATKEKAFPSLIDIVNDFPALAGTPADEVWAEATVIEETMNPIPPPPNPDNVISALTTPDQPTGIHASTGLTADGKAFILIQWDAMAGASAYDVEWKLGTSVPWTYTRVNDTALRVEGLIPNTSYDYSVEAVNAFGVTSGFPTPASITTSADSTAPANVSGFSVVAGLVKVIATWTANTESDLKDYKVEVATDSGFTSIVQTSYLLATVFAFEGSPNTAYWVRVKARDTSGNLSASFASGTATTARIVTADYGPTSIDTAAIAAAAVTGAKIAANTITAGNILAGTITATEIAAHTITAALIAAGTITATEIAAGTITADRMVTATITAASGILADAVITTAKIANLAVTDGKINDLAVGKLTAGTLSAAVILSGSIKTGTSGLRVEEDANGIRLYGYPLPYIRSQGADASGTGAVTVTLPPQHITNDILVMYVTTQGNETAPTTPTGYTKKDEVASGSASTDTRLTVFYKRDGGSESNPSLATTTKRQTAFMIAVAGCVTSGDPFDATATSSEATSDTSASVTGSTTTVPNTLALIAIAAGYATDLGNVFFTAITNSNITALAAVKETAAYSGTSHLQKIGLAGGAAATAGAFGTTTETLDQNSSKAMWSGALKSTLGVTVNLDATSGNGSFTGTVTGSKFYSPDTTSDRGVLGIEAVNDFLGAGITVFRQADIEGAYNSSGIIDFVMGHGLPGGAGTGNYTELGIAAIGSNGSDQTSQTQSFTTTEYAEIILQSGFWNLGAGEANSPNIQFYLQHYAGTSPAAGATAKIFLADATPNVNFSGIHVMPDLFRARGLVQTGAVTLTWPGASSRTNNQTVTFASAWSAGNFRAATMPRSGTGANFPTIIACIGSSGGTSMTLTGLQVAEGTPANGQTVEGDWVALSTNA